MTPPETETARTDEDFVGEEGGGTDEERSSDTGTGRRQRRRERASDKTDRVAAERFEQARDMAVEFRHLRDCPEEGAAPGDEDRRVEHFPATKPRTETEPSERMLVIHCMECGESEVAPDESEET